MKLTVKINGDSWDIRVVTVKQMKKIKDKGQPDPAGLCIPSEKTIYVDEECVNYDTICHEITHAYWSGLHLDDTTTVPLSDIEEILCSLMAAKGDRIIRQAKKVTKDLLKLIGEENV